MKLFRLASTLLIEHQRTRLPAQDQQTLMLPVENIVADAIAVGPVEVERGGHVHAEQYGEKCR